MDNNNQRNANISLQPSSFNGGANAQSFNFQSMRVIKGYSYVIPPEYSYNTQSNNVVFINPYNGSPIYLGCGDVIISSVIETYADPIQSLNNTVNIQLAFASCPSINNDYNIWEPGIADMESATQTISLQQLNNGLNVKFNGYTITYGSNGSWPVAYNTPLFYNNWINCVVNMNGDTITSPNPIVKLTLLVLNSFNA